MLTRTLLAARTKHVRIKAEISNQIRGLMKTFGLVIPAGKGSTFEANVHIRLEANVELAAIIRPLLEAWRSVRLRAAELTKRLIDDARQSEACQLLMSIPGVGVIPASAFVTAAEIRPTSERRDPSAPASAFRSADINLGRSTTRATSPDEVITRFAVFFTRRRRSFSPVVRERARPGSVLEDPTCGGPSRPRRRP